MNYRRLEEIYIKYQCIINSTDKQPWSWIYMFQALVRRNMCSYSRNYSVLLNDVEVNMLSFHFLGEAPNNLEKNISDTSWCWPGTYEDLLRMDGASVIFG